MKIKSDVDGILILFFPEKEPCAFVDVHKNSTYDMKF